MKLIPWIVIYIKHHSLTFNNTDTPTNLIISVHRWKNQHKVYCHDGGANDHGSYSRHQPHDGQLTGRVGVCSGCLHVSSGQSPLWLKHKAQLMTMWHWWWWGFQRQRQCVHTSQVVTLASNWGWGNVYTYFIGVTLASNDKDFKGWDNVCTYLILVWHWRQMIIKDLRGWDNVYIPHWCDTGVKW